MAEATIITQDLAVPNAKAKIISISGQLDESNVDMKAKDVYKVFDENPGKLYLVFDLQGLTYMSSKSVGYLTDWYGKVAEREGKMYIARAAANIKDILQVVGLTQLIQTFDSLDEAKQAVIASNITNVTPPVTPLAQAEAPAVTPVPVAPAPVAPAPVTPAQAAPAPVSAPAPETFNLKQ